MRPLLISVLAQTFGDLNLEAIAATGGLVALTAVAVYRLVGDDRKATRLDKAEADALAHANEERDAAREELAQVRRERDELYRIAVQHGWSGDL